MADKIDKIHWEQHSIGDLTDAEVAAAHRACGESITRQRVQQIRKILGIAPAHARSRERSRQASMTAVRKRYDGRDARIVRAWRDHGESANQASKALGLPYTSVVAAIERRTGKKPVSQVPRIDWDAVDWNKRTCEISKELKQAGFRTSESYVSKMRRKAEAEGKLGLRHQPSKRMEKAAARAERLAKEVDWKKTNEQIGERLKITPKRVSMLRAELRRRGHDIPALVERTEVVDLKVIA